MREELLEAEKEVSALFGRPDFNSEFPEPRHLCQNGEFRGSDESPEAPTASDLLDAADITSDLPDPDAAMACLRRLARLLANTKADGLLLTTLREAAIQRLHSAGMKSPAKMVDAALQGVGEMNGPPDSSSLFDETEPWEEPVDSADLLEEIVLTLARYAVLPKWAAER